MSNVLDYINFRRDITFKQDPFNDVDAMILSILVYLNIDQKMINKKININEVIKLYQSQNQKNTYFNDVEDVAEAILNTKRFENIIITNYEVINNEEKLIQFAAMTFKIKGVATIVAFRGTDSSVLGWKENLKLFYQENFDSDQYASNYLDLEISKIKLYNIFNKEKCMVIGHSKGGHLAIASSYLSKFSSKIDRVINFDGPGFLEHFYLQVSNQEIESKITNYMPTDSIFGRMFIHHSSQQIVQSDQKGLEQHNLCHWKIDLNHFKQAKKFDQSSHKIQSLLEKIIYRHSYENRKIGIEMIISILNKIEVHEVSDFQKLNFNDLITIIKEMSSISKEQRKFIIELTSIMYNQAKQSIKKM